MLTSHCLYRAGGALTWNDPTYVERSADRELCQSLTQGRFSYVLGPRQMGKSSLRIRTRYKLAQEGYRCVTIQANQLMDCSSQPNEAEASHSAYSNRWCAALISTIWSELAMGEPAALLSWLASTAQLSAQQRLEKFVRDRLFEVLQRSPVAIFIDEIDAIIGTRCHRVLCHWIEHCYALRQTAAPYQNLQFAVFGCAVASAAFAHSPRLLQGDHIAIRPFTLVETYSLDQGFENRIEPSTALLKAIYRWAQGQPFLTQKLCAIAADLLDSMLQPSHQPIVVSPQTIDGWVNSWVRSHILENWRAQDNPMHLRSIFDSLMTSPNREALLALGHRIMGGSLVPSGQTPHEAEILLTGLVIVKNQRLHIANEIYRQLFTVPTQTAALTYPGQSLM